MNNALRPPQKSPQKPLQKLLQQTGTVLLDSSCSASATSLLFRAPKRVLTAARPKEVPSLLTDLDAALAEGWHVAGYLAYESGYGFETGKFSDVADEDFAAWLGYPIAWFGLYDQPMEIESSTVEQAFSAMRRQRPASSLPLSLSLDDSHEAYISKIDRIRALIRRGDLYQVNFTGRLKGYTDIGALSLYRLMRLRQPVAFAAFIQLGDVQLLSASPERFIEWSQRDIKAQPMKGTAPRGETPELDDLLTEWLQTDYNNRAENLMIVDLLRNDLSIVCEPGSVEVPRLFDVERFKTVLQMTSTVKGRLRQTSNASDLLRALFPCGSVTGAPKIRAMRRILELEKQPRGIYCGAIGHISPDQKGTFSVAIRTLSHRGGDIVLGSGGGIVWDSDSAEELKEALLKTQFLADDRDLPLDSIELIETMRWEGGIALLDHHLARLEHSAHILGYPVPFDEISRKLEEIDRTCPTGNVHVVRLLLGSQGEIQVTSRPLDDSLTAPMKVGMAETRVHSGNPFFHLKTTHRGVYEAGREEAVRRGLDEVIYLNEREELTEGTITNVFLLLDEVWYTPPLSSGVLPGIGRKLELVSPRQPQEKILYAQDYFRAEKIVLTNAVRGRVDAIREEVREADCDADREANIESIIEETLSRE